MPAPYYPAFVTNPTHSQNAGALGGPEVDDYRPTNSQSQIVFDELLSTGAVITGRRTGDFADYWGGDHHDGVPRR